jgi:hypothetical protein
MEYDIHTILDSATLVATLFVIYMIRFRLRATYMLEKDNFPLYYVVRTYRFRLLLIVAFNFLNHFSDFSSHFQDHILVVFF